LVTTRLHRVVAGIDRNDSGRRLLARLGPLCRSTGAQELIALHCCQNDIGCRNPEGSRDFRARHKLEVVRFVARSAPRGVTCRPVVEDGVDSHRTLARVASQRQADLIVVGRPAGTPPRTAAALARHAAVPVLQVVLPREKKVILAAMRRAFCKTEPRVGAVLLR
jgi:hypothetical protein